MYTKKQKLEMFDAVIQERDKLRLAVYDLTCKRSKFRFTDEVTVRASELDARYTRDAYRMTIAVSRRAMPVYMVKWDDSNVDFFHEDEIRHAEGIAGQMMRHGAWKIAAREQTAAVA
jgi:hypothetical protein